MLTESQLKDRKTGIGGSDAAAVCGMSKWKTPVDIFIDKTSEDVGEGINNRFTYWGSRLESVLIEEYIKQSGINVKTDNPVIRHPKNNFMLANIDGMAEDGAIIECKTASFSDGWGDAGTDEIPDEYLIQCAHYAVIYDAPRVDIAVLIGGNDFRIYTYNRNHVMEGILVKRETEFWNDFVLKNTPPPSLRKDDFSKLIKKTSGNFKNAGDSVISLISMVSNIKKQIKDLEAQEESAVFSLKEIISDFDGLDDDSGNILATWKFQKQNRIDVNAIKNELPDVYNKYLKSSQTRVFRLKGV